MTETPALPWAPLAAEALRAGVAGRWAKAAAAVNRLTDNYGGEVVPNVLCAWIDTALIHCAPPSGEPVHVAWFNTDTGELGDADDVPPPVRWAGRLVAARVADDREQFTALIDAVRSDDEWSAGCSALLQICALTLRHNLNGAAS
ncbi:hypothetical protein [Saccharopolyspora taberi]|uniref:Uncharacterized protein n=1 Tax=Saccharopolyspora taberi TaxID=60895 RepID=A0ABN3UZT5_9PSEU